MIDIIKEKLGRYGATNAVNGGVKVGHWAAQNQAG